MKTPRDILLGRHQNQGPQLDALRAAAIARVKIDGRPDFAALVRAAWGELFWSCRQAWTGLAAVWLVIIALNLGARDPNPSMAGKAPPAAEVIATFREQRRLMAELIDQREPVDAEPQKPNSPRPRTEGFISVVTV